MQLFQSLGHVIAVERPLRFLACCLSPPARRFAIVARDGLGTPVVAFRLHDLRDFQHMPQALVLHDGPLVDFGQPVIAGEGQGNAMGPGLDAPVGVMPNRHVLARQGAVARRVIEKIQHLVVLQSQALRHAARLLPRQDQFQILVRPDRPVAVMAALRRLGKAPVVVGDEKRHEGVGGLQRADPAQAQFLHQPVLQRQMGAFDPALGLAGIGADALDVQRVQRPPELGAAAAVPRRRVVDAEHAGLVAVEGGGLAMPIQVGARRDEVAEGRLAAGEMDRHDAAGGVVHIDQRRAGRCPFLEPTMVAAVDLDQLAQAVAAAARLVDLGRTLQARHPVARPGHEPAHRLLGQDQPLAFRQLLACQGGAEVGVAAADQPQGPLGHPRRKLVVAGLAATARRQPGRAFVAVAPHQPPQLAARDPEPLGRQARLQVAVHNRLDRLQPVEFAHAHRDALGFCRHF